MITEPQQTTDLAPMTLPATRQTTVVMGMAPTTLEEGWRLATMFAKSDLVPKNFRNKPEDIMVAVQMGIEIGFAPMQALQSIAVINGRPGVWGDGFLALLMSDPRYQDHDEYYEVDGQRRDGLIAEDLKKDTTAAVCTFWRRGKAIPVTRRFTVAQAKKASLLGKEGPWQSYPDRMLSMRAREFAGRDAFPDVLRGIKTAESLRDEPAIAASIIQAPRVQRLSETTPAAPPSPTIDHTEATPAPAGIKAGIKAVASLLGGNVVTLTNGQQLVVESEADATELAKFVGTDHVLDIAYASGDDARLYVIGFRIAD